MTDVDTVIGPVLPLAVGIAVSPVPVIAAILMLLSPRARVTGVGFLVGWVLGILTTATVFAVLASLVPDIDPSAGGTALAVVQIVLGALLVLLAVRQWMRRPRTGEEPELPRWMQALDRISFRGALGLGFLLSSVNPKNLLLAAAAGVVIGSAELPIGQVTLLIAIFAVIAASTVAVPVIGYLFASDRLRGPLDRLKGWLARENAVIMAVLLFVIGVTVIANGIAGI